MTTRTKLSLFVGIPATILMFLSFALLSNLALQSNHTVQLPPKQQVETSPTTDELWLATNVQRQANGEAPLTLDPRLTASATAKCVDMVANNYWAHVSPTGVTWDSFIQQQYARYQAAGENIARGYDTSQAVVNAWMASPGHRANILDVHYNEVGYAICSDSQSRIMVVQQFVGE